MKLNHLIQSGDNQDLTEEREKCTFSTKALALELYGTEMAERRREITDAIAKTPSLKDPFPRIFMNREQKIENATRKTLEIMKATDIFDITDMEEMRHMAAECYGHDGTPIALHFQMFMPALQGQADDQQLEEWMSKALSMEFIGTYAQTELGHGTNLRKLETIATYDKAAQEFILHSPTITSLKWWPGNLGKTSNVAVVTAQLHIDAVNHGPHNFFVQLRDFDTHMPLKGLTIGDIGPKFGVNTVDNGFLKFDHFRIPRRNMLMRHSKVEADGTFTRPPHPKLSYGAMIAVRANMIGWQAQYLSHAVTVAIRYSCVRRQGEIVQGKGEVKIIDYQTQQHRLFPQLARLYAFWFTAKEVMTMFQQVSKDIKDGDATLLADLHALLSGMKSVVTYESGKAIEQCRMACGGHGYASASGIPEIYAIAIAGCTYEGENMVMLLQLARYLVRSVKDIRKGVEPSSMMAYLKEPSVKSTIGQGADPLGDKLIAAFEHVARSLSYRAADRLDALLREGLPKEEAWNQNAVEMTRASRAHTRLWLAKYFRNKVLKIKDEAVRDVMVDLMSLYLHYDLIDMSHYLYQDNYMTAGQVQHLKDNMYHLFDKIRPNAVSLVDAWEISDNELLSVLGRRDGHVYEALLEFAKSSPLNNTEVMGAYGKYLRPMMKHASKL